MPTSVRLDSKTNSLVNRLSRKKGQTKAQVIREAVVALARSEALACSEGEAKPHKTLYEALGPLVGRVKGLPKDLSESTGEKFRAILIEKQRRSSS